MSHPGLSLLLLVLLVAYLVLLLAQRRWGGGWWRGGSRRTPGPDLPGNAKKLADDVLEKAASRAQAKVRDKVQAKPSSRSQG